MRDSIASNERDRHARSPAEVSAPGWRAVVVRTLRGIAADNVPTLGAGIAFYVVWALFPAVTVLVVFAAMLLGHEAMGGVLSALRPDLPESFDIVVVNQLETIARSRSLSLATLVGGFLLAMWAGMRGMRGVIAALNLIYAEDETRTFWRRHAAAALLTVGSGAFVLVTLMLIVGLAPRREIATHGIVALLSPSRWPLLVALMMLGLSFLYRYAPSRRTPRWRWVTWGAAISATIWVAGSYGMSWYATHFERFNPLLGSLGSVVIFLLWSYLTVLTVLLGARIDADLESQTGRGSAVARADRPAA